MLKLSSMILSSTQLGDDRRPFLESLEMTAEAGFDYVSLLSWPGGPVYRKGENPPNSFINVFASDREDVLEAIRAAGLGLKHIHAGGLDLSTDETTERSVEAMVEAAKAVAEFGANAMSFGVGPRFEPGATFEEKKPYLDRAVWAYKALADRLADVPVRLGADVHFRAPMERVEDCAYVLEQSGQKKAGLCLNMGHLTTVGERGWELVLRFPEHIVVAAYKDHVAKSGEPPQVISLRLGAADTPFEEYVRALKAKNVETCHVISIEHEPWEKKLEAMRESVDYLRRLWDRTTV